MAAPSPPGPHGPAAPPSLPQIRLLGVPIHALTARQAIAHVLAEMDAGRGGWIATPNLDHLRRLVKDRAFADLCAEASLRVADGMPLVWASRLQGTPLPERVAGSDLVTSLTAAAAAACRSLFLLGGNEGVAEEAATLLQARHPGLVIAGTSCPSPGFEHDARRLQALEKELAAAAPDLVYVALGSPKQEQLMQRLAPSLPRAWWMGVGISLSFLTGEVRRAPPWLRRLGLEWLHRLAQEPRRLARRYLLEGLPFAATLLGDAALQRLRRRRAAS